MGQSLRRIGDALRPVTDTVGQAVGSVGRALATLVEQAPMVVAGLATVAGGLVALKGAKAAWKIGRGAFDLACVARSWPAGSGQAKACPEGWAIWPVCSLVVRPAQGPSPGSSPTGPGGSGGGLRWICWVGLAEAAQAPPRPLARQPGHVAAKHPALYACGQLAGQGRWPTGRRTGHWHSRLSGLRHQLKTPPPARKESPGLRRRGRHLAGISGCQTGARWRNFGGPIGIAIGGILGGAIGSFAGDKLGGWLANRWSRPQRPSPRRLWRPRSPSQLRLRPVLQPMPWPLPSGQPPHQR